MHHWKGQLAQSLPLRQTCRHDETGRNLDLEAVWGPGQGSGRWSYRLIVILLPPEPFGSTLSLPRTRQPRARPHFLRGWGARKAVAPRLSKGRQRRRRKPRWAGSTQNCFRVRGKEPPWNLAGLRGRRNRGPASEAKETQHSESH